MVTKVVVTLPFKFGLSLLKFILALLKFILGFVKA